MLSIFGGVEEGYAAIQVDLHIKSHEKQANIYFSRLKAIRMMDSLSSE